MERESSRVASRQVVLGRINFLLQNGLTTVSFTDIQPSIESLYHLNNFAALG
jgi:hypothetical protein